MRLSQNLPLPPRIYLPFQQLYATLPEYILPSQNIPSFSTTICDPPRIYPSLPEYTPFSTTIILCDPPRIYTSLPDYTLLFNNYMRPSQNILPFSTNLYVRPSQNLPLPPRIYPPPLSRTIRFCDPPKICPSLPEYFSVLGASGRFSHSHM